MTKSEANVSNTLTVVLSCFYQLGRLIIPDKSGLCLSNTFYWDYMGRFAIFNPSGSQRKAVVCPMPTKKIDVPHLSGIFGHQSKNVVDLDIATYTFILANLKISIL